MEEQTPAPPLHEAIRARMDGGRAGGPGSGSGSSSGGSPGGELGAFLDRADPVEIAHSFFHFGTAERLSLIRAMSHPRAAEVFRELDGAASEALLDRLEEAEIAAFIPFLEPDDAADLVGMLEQGRADALLARLHPDERREISDLLRFPEDSAGGLMDPDAVKVRADQTVAEAIEDIRRYVQEVQLDNFFSLFVVSDDGKLVGVVPNWKMLLARPEQSIREIMEPEVISVPATMDQEEISHLVRDHDLVTVPVVDEQTRLIGRITVDDVVDVMEEEHQEDLGRLAGTGAEEVQELSVVQTVRDRMPWLLFALAGGLLSAVIMQRQEGFFAALPQLAFFIPLVMAMGGNTGMQSSSLVIRGLATGEVRLSHFRWRVLRETLVSLSIGAMFAVLLLLGVWAITGSYRMGAAVGLATMAGIVLASTAGTAIPMILRWFKYDPALGAGPFLTTLNDVVGILLYLAIAYLLLF